MASLQCGRGVIEPATSEDLESILTIEQESFSSPWTRKMFEVELDENPFGHLYAARQVVGEGLPQTVGYICFWILFEEFRLMTLAVTRLARRQGVGRELLRRALNAGFRAGARRALLEVRASNSAAVRLYEQAGFRRSAVRAQYYSNPIEDAVLMEKEPLTANSDS